MLLHLLMAQSGGEGSAERVLIKAFRKHSEGSLRPAAVHAGTPFQGSAC